MRSIIFKTFKLYCKFLMQIFFILNALNNGIDFLEQKY
jgi:hypothetical protein